MTARQLSADAIPGDRPTAPVKDLGTSGLAARCSPSRKVHDAIAVTIGVIQRPTAFNCAGGNIRDTDQAGLHVHALRCFVSRPPGGKPATSTLALLTPHRPRLRNLPPR